MKQETSALRIVEQGSNTAGDTAAVVPPLRGYQSWGRWPAARQRGVIAVNWACSPPDLSGLEGPFLAYGLGRSYGDVCLNDGGLVIDTRGLSRILRFDRERGLLHCESGVSLADILNVVVPHGWFPPVTPGTKHVTVGGAIANDVHGKNHHRAGTFGCHVERLELLRSDGTRIWCSPDENPDLFAATTGGLGLTGLILSAEFRLRRVPGPAVSVQNIKYNDLREFFALSEESDSEYEYTVAWVDGFAKGKKIGRGVYMRGNHIPFDDHLARTRDAVVTVPVTAPSFLLARPMMRIANSLYYHRARRNPGFSIEHYERFFYPLDVVGNWNRLYGRRGLLQYQCVVPPAVAEDALRDLLSVVAASRYASFLAVLKKFGNTASPGMLSFPRPGVTLALDMAVNPQTIAVCEALDRIVADAGGAVYPAKDGRMSPEHFRKFFPSVDRMRKHIDPHFSSSFWRRVER